MPSFRFRSLAILGAAWLAIVGPLHAQSETSLTALVEGWAASGHADSAALAFSYWNNAGEIPPTCATCHAGAGFRDFHGLDGSAVGSIDQTMAVGGVVDCDTCHATGVAVIAEIKFPSGISLPALPNAATCMTCHQGRSSGPTVAGSLAGMEPDTVNPEITFVNPHYAAAAATNFGTEAKGLFEYPGQSYAGRYTHVEAAATCTSCHNPHSLKVALDGCASCHAGAAPVAIRTTQTDFDGDGDLGEGIAGEIAALKEMLGGLINDYGSEVAGTPVVYAAASFPYFFTDLNGNGIADPEEANRDNRYAAWTPRMLAAAHNYQFTSKDPGAFVHNPRYTLQALHDSIVDLSTAMNRPAPAIARP